MRKGLPDILACWEGKLLAIEVKTGRGRLWTACAVLVGDAPTVIRELERLTKDPQGRLL